MPRSNILIVVVDGLRASSLGAYGNTIFPTPALDKFSAESLLLDNCLAPAADLRAIYHALWYGEHPARVNADRSQHKESAFQSLPALLAGIGYETKLVTDEPQLLEFEAAGGFQHHVSPSRGWPITGAPAHARDILHTRFADAFMSASEAIDNCRPREGVRDGDQRPKLVWVHMRGMYGEWDAPIELQGSLLDDDGPASLDSAMPPDVKLAATDDPDLAFRYSCAYAGQVLALDSLWHGFADSIFPATQRADPQTNWLAMLIGARGFPLGEHRQIGGVDERLYIEQLHVPWLIRYPDQRGILSRRSNLVTHADVLPTILGWVKIEQPQNSNLSDGLDVGRLAEDGRVAWRDTLVSLSSGPSHAIRSANWSLLERFNPGPESSSPPPIGNEHGPELYVRPDDRWEANDVSKLCHEVVEDYRSGADRTLERLAQGLPLPLKVLPDTPEKANV